MEPQAEQEAEQKAEQAETTRMTQAPLGNVDSTNVKQDAKWKAVASSWMQKRRPCKECCLMSKCCFLCLFIFGFLVVLIIVFALKPGVSHEQCPSEWIGYKRKCYFISEEEENWTSSQAFCAKNESLLVVFENEEEMHSLLKHLKIDDSWIGLRKKGESFFWENGIAFKEGSFQIRNHSECAYLDAFTISTSACSLPRRWICFQLPKWMT
ncbi:C-type lectin domain family 2 member B-like [Numenius arquata]|uniref:C-type lectin domain family 2 member B-like n=1 Tax=Numenius arquata TaxID=31919 RepID=UPI003D3064B6